MLSYYKLRIDTQDREAIHRMCLRYFDFYLYSFEKQDTLDAHVHFYIETTQKEATIRNHIRKTFGSGNGIYSLKTLESVRPIEYLAYVVKDRDHHHNLPPTVVEEALLYDDKIKESLKEKKASKVPVWKKILEQIKESHDPEPDFHRICEWVVDYHVENELMIRVNQLKCYAETIYVHIDPLHGRHAIIDQMYARR